MNTAAGTQTTTDICIGYKVNEHEVTGTLTAATGYLCTDCNDRLTAKVSADVNAARLAASSEDLTRCTF